MEKLELRMLNVDIATPDNEKELIVEGIVNKTNTWSNTLGKHRKFREKIEKGAFKRALEKAGSIDFLLEHSKDKVLSSTDNSSLQLWEDEQGLKMKAKISKTGYGSDAYVLIKDKIINHMSFGFNVIKDSWTRGVDGIYERIIHDLKINEVSAVRNPAYSQSAIEARGIEVVEDVEIPKIEGEKKAVDINLEELKATLKAEILAEIENQRANPNPEPEEDVEKELEEEKVEVEAEEEKVEAEEEAREDELEEDKEPEEDKAEEENLEAEDEADKKEVERAIETEVPVIEAPVEEVKTGVIQSEEVKVTQVLSVESEVKEIKIDGLSEKIDRSKVEEILDIFDKLKALKEI